MKTSARSILSATTGIGLTAFTTLSAFTASASTSVTATAFGLLAIYAMVEMAIHSYSPRRLPARSARVVAPQRVANVVDFPACPSRACAA
jgi:hypothetical protein